MDKARAARTAARKRRKHLEYSEGDRAETVNDRSSMSADSDDEQGAANNGDDHKSERTMKVKRIKVEARSSESFSENEKSCCSKRY